MILTTMAQRRALLDRSTTVAMVGASANEQRPSYTVFSYLRTRGKFTVAPVNPSLAKPDSSGNPGTLDGIKAFASLTDYAAENGAPDIVDVFRKPSDVIPVVQEAIAVGARAIWFQYGVINNEAIELADQAGLDVVIDRCIKVESARFDGGLATSGLNSGRISSKRL